MAGRVAQYIPCLNATVDDLNKDPWFLNVENGTVGLKTGELLTYRKEDMITKLAKVRYDKDANCPMWKQFVREIMDYKADLAGFLQTAAGWTVSGDTSEQSLFILYGTGANGKSTFPNVIQNILGDYALSTYVETFTKRNNDTATNATDEYRGEMDVIGNFMRVQCAQRPGTAIRARELFQVYQDWCDENNEMATNERMFGIRLKELGMVQKRTSEARFMQGLAVQA
jgi:phage/plasmid-associated DNA primase